MLAIKIWNYLRGYVIIRIEGLTLEKFLNLVAKENIYIWDIRRIDYTIVEAKVSIEGFKSLRNIVRKVKCKVYAYEKRGLPFLMGKMKKRKMLGIGFIIFLGIIFFLTSFIWEIEILGNEKIDDTKIKNILKEENIYEGVLRYKIDEDNAKNVLLEKINTFSFVSIDIEGTKLIVEVKEQDIPPENISDDTPCNIVADKKGIIKKVIAKNGKSVVKEGDVVNKGQILITGIIKNDRFEGEMLVHAEGEVYAVTRYTHTVEEPIEKSIKEETGNSYEHREYKFGKKIIKFGSADIPFKEYIEEVEENNVFTIEPFNFPISIITHKYKEVEVKKVKQNVDSLKESCQVLAVKEINKVLPEDSKIVSKDVKYIENEDKLTTIVIIEVMENIGKKQIITY
jgi:similar to stage IV sporulation protein